MAGMVHAKELEIARQLLDVELPEDPAQGGDDVVWNRPGSDHEAAAARKGEPVPDLNAVAVSDPLKAVEFLFPHYFLLPILYQHVVLPHPAAGTGKLPVRAVVAHLLSLKARSRRRRMEPTMLPYDSEEFPPIPQQDYSNIPLQQKGLHAEGFEFMRLSKDVEGLISNYQRLIDGYLAGVAPDKLAKANQLLGGNFDGKIHELGF